MVPIDRGDPREREAELAVPPNENDTTLPRNTLCSSMSSVSRRRDPSAAAWSAPTTSIASSGWYRSDEKSIAAIGTPANSVRTIPARRQAIVSSSPTSAASYCRDVSPGPCHDPVIIAGRETPPSLPMSLVSPITSHVGVAAA